MLTDGWGYRACPSVGATKKVPRYALGERPARNGAGIRLEDPETLVLRYELDVGLIHEGTALG